MLHTDKSWKEFKPPATPKLKHRGFKLEKESQNHGSWLWILIAVMLIALGIFVFLPNIF
jgi:hypothetical protein